MAKQRKVAIIGAGISGLSTGLVLSESGYDVTIFSRMQHPHITSSMAAAFWYPFWTGKVPDHSWYRKEWALDGLIELGRQSTAWDNCGISSVDLLEYFPDNLTDAELSTIVQEMWWQHLPSLAFQSLSSTDLSIRLSSFPLIGFRYGIQFTTLVINMNDYLPVLVDRFKEIGKYQVASISPNRLDIVSLLNGFNFAVNCAGLDGPLIAGDKEPMESREGIVVRVPKVDAIDKIQLIHTGYPFDALPVYIVPRRGTEPDIILGGTLKGEENSAIPRTIPWDRAPEDKYLWSRADAIISACRELNPHLEEVTPISVSVGYRPSRSSVRLEADFTDGYKGRLIHNYGHGGGGVTLSWGCARAVQEWLERLPSPV